MLKIMLSFLLIGTALARDPTQPNHYQTTQITQNQNITIDGIFIKKTKSLVLIKGHYLEVGDTIMDAKIVAINIDNIELQDSQGTFIVTMLQPIKSSNKE